MSAVFTWHGWDTKGAWYNLGYLRTGKMPVKKFENEGIYAEE